MPIPEDKQYCLNIINKEKMASDIKKAKEKNVNFVCVSLHWGEYGISKPSQEQVELKDFLLASGADIILGNNPKVIGPIEQKLIEDELGRGRGIVVAYSLGNFASEPLGGNTNISMILNIEITKEGGQTYISQISYRPIYIEENVILDIIDEIQSYESKETGAVDEYTYEKLINALETAKELTGIR